VAGEGDDRLTSIEAALKAGKPRANDASLYAAAQKALVPAISRTLVPVGSRNRQWECVTTERITNEKERKKNIPGKVADDEATVWSLKVLEDRTQAPAGWMLPGFDDRDWGRTSLPISWRLNHTALLRTTFNVEDPAVYDSMRFRGWLFRQQDIEIYLNGTLIARVNNLEKKRATSRPHSMTVR